MDAIGRAQQQMVDRRARRFVDDQGRIEEDAGAQMVPQPGCLAGAQEAIEESEPEALSRAAHQESLDLDLRRKGRA